MKTIGILGGMSWESSLEYYRIINQEIKEKLGGHHSASILMYSFDFDEVKKLQFQGKWDEAGFLLASWAKKLEDMGADMILIATNTMHKVADIVQETISVPLIHIADGTGQDIVASGFSRVALLGTAFTMEHEFYKKRLQDRYHLEVLIPDEADRKIIHDVIYNELCLGEIHTTSQQEYLRIIQQLKDQGAECVILGCTEICLLVNDTISPLPVFDTTRIHARTAVDMALESDEI